MSDSYAEDSKRRLLCWRQGDEHVTVYFYDKGPQEDGSCLSVFRWEGHSIGSRWRGPLEANPRMAHDRKVLGVFGMKMLQFNGRSLDSD